MTRPERIAVIIDTDGGTDDAVALWWALTDPRVELLGLLATWGNVDLAVAAATCCRVLAAAGRPDVPVALGADDPLGPTPLADRATFVHGDDGLGGSAHRWPTDGVEPTVEPAGELLARVTAERPGEVSLVTVGPLSTTAAALRDDPSIAGRVRELVVMGGVVAKRGNAMPLGEANVAHDPIAAAEVVAAGWASVPMLVGLDATHRALLDEHHLALADEGRTTAARMLAGPLWAYAGFYARSRQTAPGTFPCHDLLAVIAAADAGIITEAPTVPLAVDTGGSAAWGTTVADLRPEPEGTPPGFRPWRVALDVDADRFRAETERLLTSSH